MATPFAHAPRVDDELPSLSWVFPLEFEREWVITWQPAFCKESMSVAFGICVAYLILCFVGRRIMRDRKPFNLKGALAIWNLSLATFSALGASRVVPFLFSVIYRRGLYQSMCAPPTPIYGHGPVSLWLWLFIVSKVPELVDTVFIVLRKKPLIFLHWYHHITVLLYCWHAFGTRSAIGTYFVAMNYSVHAVMYFYYFLMACGYRPRWARFVTMFQLSQMGVGIAVCSFNVYYMKQGVPCSVDPEALKWGIIMYSSYFALFLKFFIERYLLRSARMAMDPVKKTH